MSLPERHNKKIITVSQYLQNRDFLHNHHYRMSADGCGYVVGEEIIPREIFEKPYPVPLSFVMNNKEGADGTKNWLAP